MRPPDEAGRPAPAGCGAPGGADTSLAAVVDALSGTGNGSSHLYRAPRPRPLPSRDEVAAIVETLRSILFPGYFGTPELTAESMRFHVGAALDRVSRSLGDQVGRGLCFFCAGNDPDRCPDCYDPIRCADCEDRARMITARFIERLPEVRRLLATDVAAAFEGDPAATSPDEAIFCYPGIRAITSHRIAHELQVLGVPIIPRMIAEIAHGQTGIDIHPGAVIGERFFIDHGTGVVIGETCVIGSGVRIYQGVTLGARSLPLDGSGRPVKGVPRHPIIEDGATIYSGATILGRVVIGKGAVIGGNVWLTESVPPGAVVSQARSREDRYAAGDGI